MTHEYLGSIKWADTCLDIGLKQILNEGRDVNARRLEVGFLIRRLQSYGHPKKAHQLQNQLRRGLKTKW